MSVSITPAIYKIDLSKTKDKVESKTITTTRVHAAIHALHLKRIKEGQSNAKPFHVLTESQQLGKYKAVVYGTTNNTRPHAWSKLFPEEIEGLEVKYPNLAAFIATDDVCYAISSGMGYTLFEQFIDTSFPLEVARHIMSPKLNATTERDITGAVYGRMQQFRTSQLIVSSQNLGTVWQAITGFVTDEVKNRPDFVKVFEPTKAKISVDAGSSLKIHKAVEIDKLIELLDWIDSMVKEDISPEQREAFKFLDGLREISPRKNAPLIDEVRKSLASQLLASLTKDEPLDFDYSHKKFMNYQSAEVYQFGDGRVEKRWLYPPSAAEVFDALKDAGLLPVGSSEELLELLEKTNFHAVHSDTLDETRGSVLDHIHGEIRHNGKSYFLIDGKLYTAKDNFIKRVSDDFEAILRSEHFAPDEGLTLSDYLAEHEKEGEYNEAYIGRDKWLVADRVFVDSVEIADLLHWGGGKLYVIHNKIGFGVTVRDVCSQVLHSMNIINRIKDTGDVGLIELYYEKIISKYYTTTAPPIAKEDFVNHILSTSKNDITYVIGYVQDKPVDGASRSNIAKFEIVKLCNNDRRAFDFNLKVMHIEKNDKPAQAKSVVGGSVGATP